MRERGLVQAECPACGSVIAKASALACAVSEADDAGLSEFPCPTCDRVLLIPVAPIEISSLLFLGAHKTRSCPSNSSKCIRDPASPGTRCSIFTLSSRVSRFPRKSSLRDERHDRLRLLGERQPRSHRPSNRRAAKPPLPFPDSPALPPPAKSLGAR